MKRWRWRSRADDGERLCVCSHLVILTEVWRKSCQEIGTMRTFGNCFDNILVGNLRGAPALRVWVQISFPNHDVIGFRG